MAAAPATPGAMIEIEGLVRRFGTLTAVGGISLTVRKGEVLGFLGPNGAGKSTTMRVITGYLPPTAGTARVCGQDIQTHPIEAKRKIGFLPEGAPLYGDMTVMSFLDFIARIRNLAGAEKKKRIEYVIARMGLAEVLRSEERRVGKECRL